MMDMEESIYDIIPREPNAQHKAPRHVSKSYAKVKEETRENKASSKTMGPAKVKTNAPTDFLKKHEKEPKLPTTDKFEYPDNDRKRPQVPRKDDLPIMGLKTTKDFIKQNAVENIMSVPTKPSKNFVDTKKGDKHLLDPSGLEPRYIHKKEFGKTPVYLSKRQDEIKLAQDEYDAYVAEHFRRGAMQQLSHDERSQILGGLKANWEQLHHEYQGLSVVTDTAPKKNRKERMEASMKQLERDIELIEKHRTIYVAN